MTRTAAQKMGIIEGTRAFLVNVPEEVIDKIDLPVLDMATELSGDFDYIHFFTKSQGEFKNTFPQLKMHLKPTGMLWVSWPKNGKLDTDLRLTTVIELGYNDGLVESKTISIDGTWSAIKFTHPKDGKVYNNSYGKLPS
jgi:hypothetical protein